MSDYCIVTRRGEPLRFDGVDHIFVDDASGELLVYDDKRGERIRAIFPKLEWSYVVREDRPCRCNC